MAESALLPGLPVDKEAEAATLGSALLAVDAADVMLEIIRDRGVFYADANRIVYDAISELRARSEPCDGVTMCDVLRAKGQLEIVGGASYLSALASSVPTPSHARKYAEIVVDKATRRQFGRLCQEALGGAYSGGADYIERLEAGLLDLQRLGPMAEAVPYSQIISRVFDIISERQAAKSPITGVATGFPRLDEMTAGLQPGELCIVGARPSMGKSAFVRVIAENVAKQGNPVLFVSREDTPENIAQRSLAGAARVNLWQLRQGKVDESGWGRISRTINDVSRLPIWTLGPVGATIQAIKREAKKVIRSHGKLSLIVVDYMQLMEPPRRRESRHLEIGDISQALKAVAQEYRVPMLAVAQLSRALEARQNKRPQLSDLRESGSLEQDGDLVMFLYRDDYYNPEAAPGITEVTIAKQRNGPTGTVQMFFRKEQTAFFEIEEQKPPPGHDGHARAARRMQDDTD